MGIDILRDEEVSRIISIYEEENPKINSLNEDQKRNLVNMVFSSEEVVGISHIINRFLGMPSTLDDDVIRCYVGYEPSGKAHVGWLVQALSLRRILQSGGNVLIFLADLKAGKKIMFWSFGPRGYYSIKMQVCPHLLNFLPKLL